MGKGINVLEKSLEILVISHKYPPSIGGMQKQCYELVEGLSKKTKVHRLIQTEGVSKLLFFLTAVSKARKILKANPEISLIYVNDGLMAFVLTKLLRGLQVPIVVTIHGLDIVFPMQFYQRWVKSKLSKYDAVVAVSDATQKECLIRGLNSERVHMVKNGFELPSGDKVSHDTIIAKLKSDYDFDPENKRIIVSIGRGVRRKGFSWFVRNVLTQLPDDVCYLIVGPPANTGLIKTLRFILPKRLFDFLVLFAGLAVDEVEIVDAIKEFKLSDRVRRVSHLSNEELTQLIQLADISVMPNVKVEGDFEGFGLVALEAASNATMCVAAGIEGITTAIEDGVNGILLPSGDDELWVKRLEGLLDDEDKLNEMSMTFQQNTLKQSYSWGQMVEEYYDIFKQVAQKGRTVK
ncbi:glycosyltransferase family 4 protein [Marinoscillum sp. MHG1-6]|uniref:glycosyltransferase family 4 protein n=1 Tax=Marinoscillum sp. MHG1-6 TaxID=2959627 RepID=UPI0021578C12|nr:glycosyltransferase family 4 protein [Marinoscillum sp. MHG1-6]